MTDRPDTAVIRARYCGLPTNGIVVDAAAVERDVAFLCDALDDARQCVSHANLHADCAIADMTVLRAENERLREAVGNCLAAGLPSTVAAAARAALAQKEGE